MIGLADCNNFFVSCERSVDARLEGRAVVVLSNNDGCVVARSNEAKRMGVRMGQPAFEVRDLVERGQLIAISGHHLLYREISLRVHDIFRRFVPAALDYSVDEAFLDMSGIPLEALPAIGEGIYEACWREEHIPVTVGFAPTKTLAKISTEVSKKSGVRVGLFPTAASAREAMEKLPISELWGIGRRNAKKLYQCGVYTIAHFADKNVGWVRQKLGVNGERTWRELHGEKCIELSHVDRLLQDSISESRTFPEDVDDYDYIRARIVIYASDCARKLRAMKGVGLTIGVFLRLNPFHPQPLRIKPEASVRLSEPTSDTSDIVNAAIRLLDSIYLPGVAFKRAGVWISDIEQEHSRVGSLFDLDTEELAGGGRKECGHVVTEAERERKRKFMSVIDRINSEVGKSRIGLATQIVKGHQGHNDGYSSSFQAPSRKK